MNSAHLDAAAAVMKAASEGSNIEYRRCGSVNWTDATSPSWDWAVNEYRVKPVISNVELLGWFSRSCGLMLLPKNVTIGEGLLRVPSEDKTIEVVL